MNAPNPARLLQQIAKIQHMERGKLSIMREGPDGTHYKHQVWKDRKNVSRHVPDDQAKAVQAAIDGYRQFQELTRPMREIVADVNRTLKGWFEYFPHRVKKVFAKQVQFVRQRLRTLQRKRHKVPRRARGRDDQRWPNAYLVELGLISLALARDQASRPQR